jgi:hypothetical protein
MMKILTAVLALSLIAGMAGDVEAAKKKKAASGRNAYTSEQRAKFHADALAYCRKKYSALFHKVEIDYKYNRVTCWTY